MTIPTPTPTPEQIAEAIRHLRSIGSFTRDSAYSICNEAADLIEALAARLAEARYETHLRGLREAVYREQKAVALRDAALARIDYWRSMSANQRGRI